MTKADIVNEVSKNTGIEKVTVQKAVEAFMETVKDSLTEGRNVYLRGFGSFSLHHRPPRIGPQCHYHLNDKTAVALRMAQNPW